MNGTDGVFSVLQSPQPKSNSQSDWSEAGSLRDNLGDQLAIHVGQPHIPAVEKVS